MTQSMEKPVMVRFLLTAFLWSVVLFARNIASAIDTDQAKSWNQWRGPTRDAKVSASEWPNRLSPDCLTQKWSVDLGPSYSGPIVTPDYVFATSTENKQFEVVHAFDRQTGKQIWEQRWEGSISVPFFAKSNGDWIRATPAFDGDRLYVAGIRDVLVCLNGKTGEPIWHVDFVELLGSSKPSFGCASSPLLHGDHVFMQAGGGFLKINKHTGEIVWRVLEDGGGMSGGAFSSPHLVTLGAIDQILVQTRTRLVSIDPESGKTYWEQEIPAFRGMNILTPTVIGQKVFTSSYGGRSFCYAAELSESSWRLTESWTNKLQGYMSSPIVIDEYIYIHLRNQRFACIHASTGEIQWTTKPYGKYWSLVANGEKILALDQSGKLLLIRANPAEFQLLDSRDISDQETWAHLAVVENEICIRHLNRLAVYNWKDD